MQQPINGDRQRWEHTYGEWKIEEMPWYYPDLDPDLARALKERNIRLGRFLDLGAGVGTQAIALAKMGFEVTATDISEKAVGLAKVRAEQEQVVIDFRQDDILDTGLDGEFDYIFDKGCFHVMSAEQRDEYVGIVYQLLELDGYLFLECYSHKQEGTQGPNRLSPEQIEGHFAPCFTIESISETVFHRVQEPLPKALFCVMRKRAVKEV